MSPNRGVESERLAGFPRVSGDEPHSAPPLHCGIAFSPRERG